MSWVTDAGVVVEVPGFTFVVGSTVFYTALLLGAFVVYVFDGPSATRVAISTVAAVSALTPLVAAIIHAQAGGSGGAAFMPVPVPTLRTNVASIATTLIDLVFLGIAWEYLAKPRFELWMRAYLTLLGVMSLDVLLFSTAAFAGSPSYLSIMQATFVSRLVVSILALPFLVFYLYVQRDRRGTAMEHRPVLSILRRVAQVEAELDEAQGEIERRKRAEAERDGTIRELQQALSEVKTLRGLLPICSHCKRIRDDRGLWTRIEAYVAQRSDAEFSHGICPE